VRLLRAWNGARRTLMFMAPPRCRS
jgi:hypothetical protein